ncbi:membrane protease YdiL (CAAX protease family) [Lachnospiraceae bacterium PF1-21]|uniref:CPBP family intramembrane metalloprotease n=2 Tax=Ohessyouella blattaphilus TaxID=2949333 RepID=A0ABT1EGT2_9FIRM|nr:CPBP family intramembrane glutamic endopeptidase [Ohessyouella blattaphilus]MCP1109916.1 CPBP family intramembrane metalloprotease [Ohessyouella blattaphilus]MCR8563310.1 CPBP family intramembrane metalloprotease [Ohessyouella blattaphilus]
MENNNQQQMEQVINARKRFFRVWSPVLIQQLGTYLIIIFVMAAITMAYVVTNPSLMGEGVGSQEWMNEMYKLAEMITLKYQVFASGIASALLLIPFGIMFYLDRKKERALGSAPTKKAGIAKYGYLFITAVALHFVLNSLIFIAHVLEKDEYYAQTQEMIYAAPLWAQILFLGICGPLLEELVYRGLVFKRMREKQSFIGSALLSTAMFAFLHGNVVQMLYSFALGMLFCYVYEKYGRIAAPMAAHVLLNLVSIVLTAAGFYEVLVKNEIVLMGSTVIVAGVGAMAFMGIRGIKEKLTTN